MHFIEVTPAKPNENEIKRLFQEQAPDQENLNILPLDGLQEAGDLSCLMGSEMDFIEPVSIAIVANLDGIELSSAHDSLLVISDVEKSSLQM